MSIPLPPPVGVAVTASARTSSEIEVDEGGDHREARRPLIAVAIKKKAKNGGEEASVDIDVQQCEPENGEGRGLKVAAVVEN
tara:strand:+ start:207 stop:452 length:246 start_codon:yes stop_codon:yes gene_type:complete